MTERDKKVVLVLGAGHVSGPLIEYLTRDVYKSFLSLKVASAIPSDLDEVRKKYPGVSSTCLLNVTTQPDLLEEEVRASDIVVSLLPFFLHPIVASICIREKVDMVTASYFSGPLAHPDILKGVKQAGIIMLNEVGLDPGIDHMLAMDCINQIHAQGGKVKGFISYCGGLPAPEANDNPLRYRFSWAPRDVLRNTLRAARYLKDGQIVEIPEGGEAHIKPMEILPLLPLCSEFDLEATPNRDSLIYKERYGIPHARTILRGTLRFQGFARAIEALQKLELIDPQPHPVLIDSSRRQFIGHLLLGEENICFDGLKTLIVKKLGSLEQLQVIEKLGLLDDVELLEKKFTPLETLSHFLSKKLSFDGERDLVIMLNKISICWPNGREEEREIRLVVYGDPQGYSAMAKTVGYTAAIAAKMILDGEIKERGCILPLHPEIYTPILARLKEEGIEPKVTSTFTSEL